MNFIKEYNHLLIILLIISYIALSYKIRTKNIKKIILVISCLFVLSIITLIFYVKTIPQFEKGNCFTQDVIMNAEPTEEWHKPFLVQKIEYIILKVGKNNYYVSTTIPSLGDFLIKDDYKVEKSNCDIIFQRGQ